MNSTPQQPSPDMTGSNLGSLQSKVTFDSKVTTVEVDCSASEKSRDMSSKASQQESYKDEEIMSDDLVDPLKSSSSAKIIEIKQKSQSFPMTDRKRSGSVAATGRLGDHTATQSVIMNPRENSKIFGSKDEEFLEGLLEPATIRTKKGKGVFKELYLPPPPPPDFSHILKSIPTKTSLESIASRSTLKAKRTRSPRRGSPSTPRRSRSPASPRSISPANRKRLSPRRSKSSSRSPTPRSKSPSPRSKSPSRNKRSKSKDKPATPSDLSHQSTDSTSSRSQGRKAFESQAALKKMNEKLLQGRRDKYCSPGE